MYENWHENTTPLQDSDFFFLSSGGREVYKEILIISLNFISLKISIFSKFDLKKFTELISKNDDN